MAIRYRLAVFDADGTLFDSAPGILASIRHTIETLGLPEISEAQMRTHLGPPVDLAYHRSFGLEGERLQEAVRVHRSFNTEHGVKLCQMYGGMREMLVNLRSAGVKIAVASLKPVPTLDRLLELQGLEFDAVHGYTGNGETKGDLIRMCLEDLEIPKEDAVMVGDTIPDRDGAAEAGVDFIPVTFGYGFTPDDGGAGDAESLERMILGN